MEGQTSHKILDSQVQRRLRKNPTDAEAALWRRLRASQVEGCKFRRQHPFLDYVVDFVCVERRLVVEVDGGQHLESGRYEMRDQRLGQAGFRVLRFWNNQVLGEMEAVLEAIRGALLSTPHPHPGPPLEGEGEGAALPSEGERRDGGGAGGVPC